MYCPRCGLNAKKKHEAADACVFDLRQAAFAAELSVARAKRRGEPTRALEKRANELCNRITELEIALRADHARAE